LAQLGKLVKTDRYGKDGVKYVGTPEKMKWWTDKPLGSTKGGRE